MRTLNMIAVRALLLLSMGAASGLASADDRYGRPYGMDSFDRTEWQLGSFRGGARGYEIRYRAPGDRRWRSAPGAAIAIADGWVLGTDHHRGGYGIYRWNGRDWSRMPGTAVQIGGSYQQPWVVNEQGVRFVWSGRDWQQTRFDDRRDRRDRRDNNRRDDRDDRNDRRERRNHDWR